MQYELFDAEGRSVNCCASVIHDTKTGLYWEANPPDSPMNWDGFTHSHIDRLNEENYGGFSDWRVPSKYELRSLVDYRKYSPAFRRDVFRSLAANDYWCGVSYGLREDCGWVINLNVGAATVKNKSLLSYGVAVRGEKLPSASERFIDNGDGTVTDKALKLMWQKPQNERKSYVDVVEMLKSFEFAGHNDWRLPTMQELNSIFDESCENGSWYFDGYFDHDKLKPPVLQHITSDTFADTYVWVTNFNFGYDGYYAEKTMPLCYRLVRNIADTSGSFRMPSSGQKEIYDARGNVTAINPEFSAVSFVEMPSYILDLKTGLKYGKPSADKVYTFSEAQKHVEGLNSAFYGGTNTWRLPSVDELRFIADYSKKSPAVFSVFEPYVNPAFYWASEENGQRAWAIYFGYGCAVPVDKGQNCGCIAVCGGYVNLRDKSLTRYEVRDGVVIDTYTKLMWLREELPLMTVAEADKFFAENVIAGYRGWRIPDIKELSTIFNREAGGRQWFSREIFPDIYDAPGVFFLARETFNGMFNWGCNIGQAYDGYYSDRLGGRYRVKAVRGL